MNDLARGFRSPEPEREEQRPVFSECVAGFRAWRVADWVLVPASVGHPWRPGPNVAQCNRALFESTYPTFGGPAPDMELHEAPNPTCGCGLYAMHHPANVPEKLREGLGYVLGAVAAWGNLQVHHRGFRAERAQVVALSYRSSAERDRLKPIAETYRCELVPREKLVEVAAKYGQPLPANCIPEEPTLPDDLAARQAALMIALAGASASSANLRALGAEMQRMKSKPRFWRYWWLNTAWIALSFLANVSTTVRWVGNAIFWTWLVSYVVRYRRWSRGR